MLANQVKSERERFAFPWQEMLVGLAVLVSAWVSIELTRVPGGIALSWHSSAIAAALLIRFPHLRCGRAALAVAAAFLIANVVAAHRPWAAAALFGLVNLIEIASWWRRSDLSKSSLIQT